MDYRTFATRKQAQAEVDTMQGWDTKITKLCLPEDTNADKNGNAIVIQCDNDKYLRTDGYVR